MSKHFLDANGNPTTIRAGTVQVVAVGAAHAESSAFQSSTKIVRLSSTTNCWVAAGAAAVAALHAAGSFYLAAGVVVELFVEPTDVVSVIRDTADGYLSIVEAL